MFRAIIEHSNGREIRCTMVASCNQELIKLTVGKGACNHYKHQHGAMLKIEVTFYGKNQV